MVSLSSVKAISKVMKLKRRELCFKVATETEIKSIFCFKQKHPELKCAQACVCIFACVHTHPRKKRKRKFKKYSECYMNIQDDNVIMLVLLMPKILTLCAPMLKRNTETEFWKGKKNGFIFAQQRGIHSRLSPQELCPFSLGNRGFYIILKVLVFFFFSFLQIFKMATAGFR